MAGRIGRAECQYTRALHLYSWHQTRRQNRYPSKLRLRADAECGCNRTLRFGERRRICCDRGVILTLQTAFPLVILSEAKDLRLFSQARNRKKIRDVSLRST